MKLQPRSNISADMLNNAKPAVAQSKQSNIIKGDLETIDFNQLQEITYDPDWVSQNARKFFNK